MSQYFNENTFNFKILSTQISTDFEFKTTTHVTNSQLLMQTVPNRLISGLGDYQPRVISLDDKICV